MASKRPHFSASGPQLQQIFEAGKHDLKVLRELLAELKHRSTPTSLALRKDVESAIGQANGLGSAGAGPRKPAAQPTPPQHSPPTHQTLACQGCKAAIRVPIRPERTAYGCPKCKAAFETTYNDGVLQVVWVEVKSGPVGPQSSMTEAVAREVLGVSATADFVAVKAAWRRASQQYHPDKHQGLPERLRHAAEQEMKRINEAYRFLEGSTASDF